MKPGDPVLHLPTGRRMTVKAVNGGNDMVLCCWMEKNKAGEIEEISAAFPWQELRNPDVPLTQADYMNAVGSVAPLDAAPTMLLGVPVIEESSVPSLAAVEKAADAQEQVPHADAGRPARKAKR